jgi:hypothetical protein
MAASGAFSISAIFSLGLGLLRLAALLGGFGFRGGGALSLLAPRAQHLHQLRDDLVAQQQRLVDELAEGGVIDDHLLQVLDRELQVHEGLGHRGRHLRRDGGDLLADGGNARLLLGDLALLLGLAIGLALLDQLVQRGLGRRDAFLDLLDDRADAALGLQHRRVPALVGLFARGAQLHAALAQRAGALLAFLGRQIQRGQGCGDLGGQRAHLLERRVDLGNLTVGLGDRRNDRLGQVSWRRGRRRVGGIGDDSRLDVDNSFVHVGQLLCVGG